MSMCCYIFSNNFLSSTNEWQEHINDIGFKVDLELDIKIQSSKGHLPAKWNGMEAGFECVPNDAEDIRQGYEEFDFGGPWSRVLSIDYSEIPSCAGALIAAAAYAKATDGVLFETQDGIVYNAEDAVAFARRNEAEVEALLKRIADAGGLDNLFQAMKAERDRR